MSKIRFTFDPRKTTVDEMYEELKALLERQGIEMDPDDDYDGEPVHPELESKEERSSPN